MYMNMPLLSRFLLFARACAEISREFYRNKKVKRLTVAALAINIAAWAGSVFINTSATTDVIALHHNIYFGITLIGSPRQIYLIPFLGLCIIGANLAIARLTGRQEFFFVYLFSAASLVMQFFLLLGVGSIVLINFR